MTLSDSGQSSGNQSTDANAHAHRATYTKNKTTGEFFVRLIGPDAAYASGATVPVTTKSGEVHMEELTELVFTGIDDWQGADYQATGLPLAIYKFKKQPREKKPFVF